jgi:hypothetical protein
MKSIPFILITCLLFCSCRKTTTLTQAEITAQKLTQFLGTSSGSYTNGAGLYVANNAGYLIYSATSFSISSDGYITVSASNNTSITYNLQYLKDYYTFGNSIELEFAF